MTARGAGIQHRRFVVLKPHGTRLARLYHLLDPWLRAKQCKSHELISSRLSRHRVGDYPL